MRFSWVATERYDKSKCMQKNGGETVAGRTQSNLWAPIASSKEIYTLLQKKGREGKNSSWGFLECRRILSCHGNNEDGTSCSQSVPHTLGALLKASWYTLFRWCCPWGINTVCSYHREKPQNMFKNHHGNVEQFLFCFTRLPFVKNVLTSWVCACDE